MAAGTGASAADTGPLILGIYRPQRVRCAGTSGSTGRSGSLARRATRCSLRPGPASPSRLLRQGGGFTRGGAGGLGTGKDVVEIVEGGLPALAVRLFIRLGEAPVDEHDGGGRIRVFGERDLDKLGPCAQLHTVPLPGEHEPGRAADLHVAAFTAELGAVGRAHHQSEPAADADIDIRDRRFPAWPGWPP